MSFGDFLLVHRKKNGLTQHNLLENLYFYDQQFKKLDLTTISRWENNKTVPTLSKQILIIRALGLSTIDFLEKLGFNILDLKNSKMFSSLNEHFFNPYISEPDRIFCKNIDPSQLCGDFLDKLDTFQNKTIELPFNVKKINNFNLVTTHSESNELMGHILYNFCSISALQQNLQMEYIDCVDRYATTAKNMKSHDTNILNIYSECSLSVKTLLSHMFHILNELDRNPTVKTILFTVFNQDTYNFFKKIPSIEIKDKGPTCQYHGIRYGYYNYKYIRVSLKPECLFSLLTTICTQNGYFDKDSKIMKLHEKMAY